VFNWARGEPEDSEGRVKYYFFPQPGEGHSLVFFGKDSMSLS